MRALLKWYSSNLRKHQFAMNMVTTGAVFFIGDMLSQQAVERRGVEHDTSRTVRSVVIGALYTAPAATFVYNLVDKVFGSSRSPLTALKKLSLLMCFPPLSITGYIILNNALQAKSADFILQQLREDLLTIVLNAYCLSIPTQLTLLTLIPLKHRVLCGNMVRVIWTCYLTHASNIGTTGHQLVGDRTRMRGVE